MGYEFILRTLFVHLDDPNAEIQQGIYRVLEAAVHQDYGAFKKEAQAAAAKSAHPRMCEELLRLADSLQKAYLDAEFGNGSGYAATSPREGSIMWCHYTRYCTVEGRRLH